MVSTLSNIVELARLISKNVDIIQHVAERTDVSYPTLDDLYDPQSPGEQMTVDPEVLRASLLAISAASQLIATLRLPGMFLIDRANSFHISTTMRIATECSIVEILREAGPEGMSVKEMAAKVNVDGIVLGRALRLLATHYVFKEIRPNVFANNRTSSILDTGKDSEQLIALMKKRNQESFGHGGSNVQGEKYVGTNGVAAMADVWLDEGFKASALLPDVLISNDSKSAFQKSFQYDGSLWQFYEQHPGYLQRLQVAMSGYIACHPQLKSFNGFDWSTLPEGSILVDVGGGNGSESFEIAKKAPRLNIVIQDRGETIRQVTIPTWEKEIEKKALVDSNRVKFQDQDFFENQPCGASGQVSMFHLRFITHDWPMADCIKILKRLHRAASNSTKLMIVDHLVPYACAGPSNLSFECSESLKVPPPLLANLGEANSGAYALDFIMIPLFKSHERTYDEFVGMTKMAGWKIEKVYRPLGSSLSQIVCVKVQSGVGYPKDIL